MAMKRPQVPVRPLPAQDPPAQAAAPARAVVPAAPKEPPAAPPAEPPVLDTDGMDLRLTPTGRKRIKVPPEAKSKLSTSKASRASALGARATRWEPAGRRTVLGRAEDDEPQPARIFSGRVVTSAGVIGLMGLLLANPLNNYIKQSQSVQTLTAEVAAYRQELEQVTAERDRWKDPAYVKQQARNRLFYVMPGETSYVVVGANGSGGRQIEPSPERKAEEALKAKIERERAERKQTWVETLFTSVDQAGSAGQTGTTP